MSKAYLEHIFDQNDQPFCRRINRGGLLAAKKISPRICPTCLSRFKKRALARVEHAIACTGREIAVYLLLIPKDNRFREGEVLQGALKIQFHKIMEGEE